MSTSEPIIEPEVKPPVEEVKPPEGDGVIAGLLKQVETLTRELGAHKNTTSQEAGAVRKELDEAKAELAATKQKFEDAAKKPKSTMVPPPPPPTETMEPVKDGEVPHPDNRRGGWRKIW
jgi:uncharacterized membrane protein